MHDGSGVSGRTAADRARIGVFALLSGAAILTGGCTTSDGTLDPVVQSLLATLGSVITAVVSGVVQGIAAVAQPLFTAGTLALLF